MSTSKLKPRTSSRISQSENSSFISLSMDTLPHPIDDATVEIETGITQSAISEDESLSKSKSNYIPPWTEPYIIGIAGNSGSGKTSISQQIVQNINQPWTVLLSFDNFYKSLNPSESARAFNNDFDFDCPDSLDFDLLVSVVEDLKRGQKVNIPVYSFTSHNRTNKINTIYGANVIIIEGLYALYDPRLLAMMDLKIYVDTDLDVCLARRLTRDILYRGRDLKGAIKQWENFVKPNAVKFLNPTLHNADLIIPRGLDNTIAINLMIKHIKNQLLSKSRNHLINLKQLGNSIKNFKIENYSNVKILPVTNQTRVINSILFDKKTNRDDFIFYFNRISRLLIEFASQNFFTNVFNKRIDCVRCNSHSGVELKQVSIAVNIIRSGDCFNTSLKKTFPDIIIGKLLIQSDSRTGEPQLHFESLPKNLGTNDTVMLFDSQFISGAGAIMAIQVLIDHNIKEENIIIITYLSTEISIRRILHVFPNVKIVIGKLSSMEKPNDKLWYNEEEILDTSWPFRNRFIDSLYFGTD
ncbi:unnamed protein product [Candida verbasci]|uniref:Uridine kinase n=1 Tax=Candida verbasci TaxID=1227364 RepID=A0A9W4XHD1_9ASCO|nr:unnamed protein product [Candida verbasci]